PGLPDVGGARPGQALERRIASEELVVLRDDALHLRLLEHDLRHEDVVGVIRGAPRQLAAGTPVPREEAPVKAPALGGIGKASALHGGIVTEWPAIAQVDSREVPVNNEPMPDQLPLHDAHREHGAVFGEVDGSLVPLHYGDPLAEYRALAERVGVV